jgi:ABC-type transport system involved in Fe-S cluster assembly fused permease/ATPase subunit
MRIVKSFNAYVQDKFNAENDNYSKIKTEQWQRRQQLKASPVSEF